MKIIMDYYLIALYVVGIGLTGALLGVVLRRTLREDGDPSGHGVGGLALIVAALVAGLFGVNISERIHPREIPVTIEQAVSAPVPPSTNPNPAEFNFSEYGVKVRVWYKGGVDHTENTVKVVVEATPPLQWRMGTNLSPVIAKATELGVFGGRRYSLIVSRLGKKENGTAIVDDDMKIFVEITAYRP